MRLVYGFNYYDDLERFSELFNVSKNLYNQANYIVRQEFFNSGDYVNYYQLDPIMKTTYNLEGDINYRLLKSHTSQQILKLLDKDWVSFLRSIKDWVNHPKKYKGKPRPPKYKKDKNLLIFTNQTCQIKEGGTVLQLYKDLRIDIPQYKNIDFSTCYKQVRVLPKNGFVKIEIIYEVACVNSDLEKDCKASLDLGINNLVALVTSKTQPLLINGNPIKSINQLYNKQKAKLSSIKDKMGIKGYTKKLYNLEDVRFYSIKDYLHKTSRFVVNYLLDNKVSQLVIGHNKNWKQGINIGKVNNQKFVQIPYSMLLKQLQYKCDLVGIEVIFTEESYTSKCDSLVLENLGKKDSYLGKRIKRGLFQSSCGKLLNADVNGALNIMRKVVSDSFVKKIIDRGLLFNPLKIRDMFSYSLKT